MSGSQVMTDGALGLSFDTRDFDRRMTEIERSQLPQATAWALNDTADEVLEHIKNKMAVVFDRPTRFTQNAFMVWRASKRTLVAEVKERPSVGSRHYLKMQERGGPRPMTGLERMVGLHLAYDGVIRGIIPTSAARLNKFGNWTPGERNQAISAIKAWRETGYSANATGASSKKAKGRRAAYFVPKKGSQLSPGIWRRSGSKKKPKIAKVAHFVDSAPEYSKRLGFYDGAEEVFDRRIGENFKAAFERAMATRR